MLARKRREGSADWAQVAQTKIGLPLEKFHTQSKGTRIACDQNRLLWRLSPIGASRALFCGGRAGSVQSHTATLSAVSHDNVAGQRLGHTFPSCPTAHQQSIPFHQNRSTHVPPIQLAGHQSVKRPRSRRTGREFRSASTCALPNVSPCQPSMRTAQTRMRRYGGGSGCSEKA